MEQNADSKAKPLSAIGGSSVVKNPTVKEAIILIIGSITVAVLPIYINF
jgi:hypothetical protein